MCVLVSALGNNANEKRETHHEIDMPNANPCNTNVTRCHQIPPVSVGLVCGTLSALCQVMQTLKLMSGL